MQELDTLFQIGFGMWALGAVLRGIVFSVATATSVGRPRTVASQTGHKPWGFFRLLPSALLLLVLGTLKEVKYRIFAPKIATDPETVQHFDKGALPLRKVAIVYVPGTWSKAHSGTPSIVQYLKQHFPGRCIMVFRWAARNNAASRNDAAQILARIVAKHRSLEQAHTIYLIGHSHGGTVCAAAASIANDARCTVVTLGAPFVEFHGKHAVDRGAYTAVFGLILWPLVLAGYALGVFLPAPSSMVARTMLGIIAIALFVRVFLNIKVYLETGPSLGYATVKNITANSDVLLHTMSHISVWLDQHTSMLAQMMFASKQVPSFFRWKRIGLVSCVVWLAAIILVAGLRSAGSQLWMVPFGFAFMWFYLHPSWWPWRVGTFAPTILVAAHPGALLLTLSSTVNFGINVLALGLGRACVVIAPKGATYIPVALTDIGALQRVANSHSAMLESKAVRELLVTQLP